MLFRGIRIRSQVAFGSSAQLRVDEACGLVYGLVDVVARVAFRHVGGELRQINVQVMLVGHSHSDPRYLLTKKI